MMKSIIFISIFLISGLATNAQCNGELLEKAKSELTDNEKIINDFKVKLKEADINDPAPVAKFYQKLEANHKYSFLVISDQNEYNSNGIIRLFDNEKLLATNFVKQTNKSYKKFVFKCTITGDYQLLVTFQDGKAGCAVVVISEDI